MADKTMPAPAPSAPRPHQMAIAQRSDREGVHTGRLIAYYTPFGLDLVLLPCPPIDAGSRYGLPEDCCPSSCRSTRCGNRRVWTTDRQRQLLAQIGPDKAIVLCRACALAADRADLQRLMPAAPRPLRRRLLARLAAIRLRRNEQR